MRPCLAAYVNSFKRVGCDTFAKWRNLKSERLLSTSIRKEIHKDFMETLEEESPSYSTVKKWAAEFKRGRESVEDDGRSGRPKDATSDENVMVMYTLVICDRRRDLRSIASEVVISFWAVQSILTDILGISKVSARWAPRKSTDDQKGSARYI